MSNELEALLIIGADYGTSEDNQCAVINLHYNGIDHFIYETHDKEQVIALDEIVRMENKKQTALTEYEAIKNTNPSEALECLEDIYRNGVFISDYDALGKQHPTNISPETNKSFDEQCKTIKQALLQTDIYLSARRNGKTLEQMYQLVKYSKPPMKPSIWVTNIDGKLEQRVIMEKEEYDKLTTKSKKEMAFEIIKEKDIDIGLLKRSSDWLDYYTRFKHKTGKNTELTEEEFNLLKEVLK